MRVILTPDDLKSGELANPGWHPAEVTDYTETEASDKAKNPGSTNCIWTFTIIDGESKGVSATKLINETPKSLGHKSNQSLWSTFGFPKIPHPNGGFGYELSSELFRKSIGFKMMIYIKRGKTNNGNDFNDIVDFKPLS